MLSWDFMAILQLRSNRKASGARYKRPKVRRLFRMGSLPVMTRLDARKAKSLRVIGGNSKDKLVAENKANVYDPKAKKHTVVEIKNVVENPANRHYVRRNILTKGCVIQTELGQARITSRPGQSAVVNAVLV